MIRDILLVYKERNSMKFRIFGLVAAGFAAFCACGAQQDETFIPVVDRNTTDVLEVTEDFGLILNDRPSYENADGREYDATLDNLGEEEDARLSYDPAQSVDKIYIEGNYGQEFGGSYPKCSPPWDGSRCAVPDSRSFYIGVMQYTCSSQKFKDQILDAANHARDVLVANGWNVLGVNTYTTTPANPGQVDALNAMEVKCGTLPSSAGLARTTVPFSGPDTDEQSTANGPLVQYRWANIVVDEVKIQSVSDWSNHTSSQQSNFVENLVRHEFGHVVGFGHALPFASNSSKLMGYPVTGDANYAAWWTGLKTYTNDEKRQLDCYKESSGTTPNC